MQVRWPPVQRYWLLGIYPCMQNTHSGFPHTSYLPPNPWVFEHPQHLTQSLGDYIWPFYTSFPLIVLVRTLSAFLWCPCSSVMLTFSILLLPIAFTAIRHYSSVCIAFTAIRHYSSVCIACTAIRHYSSVCVACTAIRHYSSMCIACTAIRHYSSVCVQCSIHSHTSLQHCRCLCV